MRTPTHIARGLAIALALSPALTAQAEPLRLRGEALGETRSPVGLLVLEGRGRERPWLEAEGLVWTGAGDELEADALVIAVKLRDPRGRAEGRMGRLILSTGAVRPLHLDGAYAAARRWGVQAEAFGGSPVVPRFGERGYDWVAGGRLSYAHRKVGQLGVSYFHQRDDGRHADDEIGVDLSTPPLWRLEGALRGAWDLIDPGLADLQASVARRLGPLRPELFVSHRSLTRLLPATSLFTVLGDAPSTSAGAAVRWNAAPRLDVLGTGAARWRDDEVFEDLALDLRLRLDDRGAGMFSVGGRRLGGEGSAFSGVRSALRLPIGPLSFATEVEVAFPDEPEGRGAAWPWALAAIGWRPAPLWETALAFEAMSSPQYTSSFQGLFRLSRLWEGP